MTFQGVGEGICQKIRHGGSSSVARCFLSFLFIRLSLRWFVIYMFSKGRTFF